MKNKEEDCSLEECLQGKMMRDNLNIKKHFLVKFLRMKQSMYMDRETSSQVLPGPNQPSSKDRNTLDLLETILEEVSNKT